MHWKGRQLAFVNAKKVKFGILKKLGCKFSWIGSLAFFFEFGIKFSILEGTLNFGISLALT